MRTQTRREHENRIEDAIRAISEGLDEPLNLTELANRVCLSPFHFHRIFQALVGETIGELARRLRLERAAMRLRSTRLPITEIAFEAGYATHEAFIKAFRAAFACTPSHFRRRMEYDGRLPTPNGVHYQNPSQIRFIALEGENAMNMEIRQIEPRLAACITHKGPYFMIGKTFEALNTWMHEAGIAELGGQGQTFALYADDPETTPAEDLKSEAGVFVPEGFTTDNTTVHTLTIAGGTYAVGVHIGAYEGLPAAWGEACRWLTENGHTFADSPVFEVYVAWCPETPKEALRTEIYIPLQA